VLAAIFHLHSDTLIASCLFPFLGLPRLRSVFPIFTGGAGCKMICRGTDCRLIVCFRLQSETAKKGSLKDCVPA
jgi:hypothetical protein